MIGFVRRRLLALKGRRVFKRKVAIFGDFTVVHPENARIGDGCAINHGVFILGRCGVGIEDHVVLSAGVRLVDAGLDSRTDDDAASRTYLDRPIRVREGAWIGVGAIILPGVEVGELSIVGAGAVVTKAVLPRTIVGGYPARMIGRVGVPPTC